MSLVGGDRGEWKTTGVKKIVDPSHRVYLEVTHLFNSKPLINMIEFRELVSAKAEKIPRLTRYREHQKLMALM